MARKLTREDTSIETRFEGHAVIEHGVAQIPNLLLKHYVHLGLTDGHYTLLSHIIARKWTADAPYPTLGKLPMSVSYDTRRAYVRDLRRRGLLFTQRMYWTKEDLKEHPYANPGKVRANLWYMGSLLHNLVRVDMWLEEKKPLTEFYIEIPVDTVALLIGNQLHDVPEEIARIVAEVCQAGVLIVPVSLPCEKRTVGLPCDFLPVENHTVMNKNQTPKKNHIQEEGEDSVNALDEFFGVEQQENPNAGLPNGVDSHQRHVDVAGGAQSEDPVEVIAKHLFQGYMGGPAELPLVKKERKKWIEASKRFLERLPAGWQLREACAAVDTWWLQPDSFWGRMPCKDETLDLIAKHHLQRRQQKAHSQEIAANLELASPRPPHEELWLRILDAARGQVTKATFDQYLAPAHALERNNGALVVSVPSQQSKEWLDRRMARVIERAVSMATDDKLRVEFRVTL